MTAETARRGAPIPWAADGALLAATLVWGASFVIVRDALREISPLLFVAARFGLAAAVLAPFVLLRHGLPDRETLRAGAVVGFWLWLGFVLQTAGLVGTSAARAAFLTGLSVVLVPPLLVALYRRPPTFASLVGVVLATAGLALLTGMGRGGLGHSDLLVLGGAGAFAFQILAVGRFTRAVGPARLLLVELATAAVLGLPAALLLEPLRWRAGREGWIGFLAISLLSTLGALLAQNYAQQRTPPTRAAVILTLEPVAAAAVSYLATGERFGPTAVVGSALILAGMLAAELLPRPEPVAGPRGRW